MTSGTSGMTNSGKSFANLRGRGSVRCNKVHYGTVDSSSGDNREGGGGRKGAEKGRRKDSRQKEGRLGTDRVNLWGNLCAA